MTDKLIWAGGETLAAYTRDRADHVVLTQAFTERVTERLDQELAAGTGDIDALIELRRWFAEYGDGLPLGYTWWEPPTDLNWTEADYEAYDTEAASRTHTMADALQAVLDAWEDCPEADRARLEAIVRGIRHSVAQPQFLLTIY